MLGGSMKKLAATDLWRGDIILTSMKLRTGSEKDFASFWAPVIANSAINLATGSIYSHAMLVSGTGTIIEFRNNLQEKSLKAALRDGGDMPSVAHVFRHVQSNGYMRERVMTEARKLVHGFRNVNAEYVMAVWLGLSPLLQALRQSDVMGMLVCSTFCARAYADAGYRLSRTMPPDSMAPGDIATCASLGVALASRMMPGSVHEVSLKALMEWQRKRITNPPTLRLVGEVSPKEYT